MCPNMPIICGSQGNQKMKGEGNGRWGEAKEKGQRPWETKRPGHWVLGFSVPKIGSFQFPGNCRNIQITKLGTWVWLWNQTDLDSSSLSLFGYEALGKTQAFWVSIFLSTNCRIVNWVKTMYGKCMSVNEWLLCLLLSTWLSGQWTGSSGGQNPVWELVHRVNHYHLVLVHTLDQATSCPHTSSKERVCPL